MTGRLPALALFALAALPACGGTDGGAPAGSERRPLIVYSALSEGQTRMLARAAAEATGIEVEYRLGDPDALIDSMAVQAYRPGADLLVVAGIRPLARAVDKDVLRPLPAELPSDLASPGLRDADGYWTSLAVDELLVVAAPDVAAVDPAGGYVALGDERLQGHVCLRGAEAEQSIGLIADLIVALGERAAEIAVRDWLRNLTGALYASDAALLAALDSGSCGVAIVSSSALARHLDAHPASRLAGRRPQDADVGPSRHVIGAGIGRHANDPAAAAALLEWLLGPAGQRLLADSGPYQPVRPGGGRSAALILPAGRGPGPSMPAASAFMARAAVDLAIRAHYTAAPTGP